MVVFDSVRWSLGEYLARLVEVLDSRLPSFILNGITKKDNTWERRPVPLASG